MHATWRDATMMMATLGLLAPLLAAGSQVWNTKTLDLKDFVQVRGEIFMHKGKRFRFIGITNYPLLHAHPAHDTTDLHSYFSALQRDGISVVRTWAHNAHVPATSPEGNFRYLEDGQLRWNESAFLQLDRVLAIARIYGIKLSLVLTNQWSDKRNYCEWGNVVFGTSHSCDPGDDFHTDNRLKKKFKEYIDALIHRRNTVTGVLYKDDPAIFSWELGNELRYTSGNDRDANTPASERVRILTNWYAEMSTYIKSKDPHHLVGTGSQSQFHDYAPDDPLHNGSYYGGSYMLQHALPTIDYFDFHLYPYTDAPDFSLRAFGQSLGFRSGASAEGLFAQIGEYITSAHSLHKPVVVGEWGVDKRNETITPLPAYPRFQHFALVLTHFFGNGGDGFMVWHYGLNSFDDDNYNITAGRREARSPPGNMNNDDYLLRTTLRQQALRL
jgi:mannan endo-1,4-beta-mannosidase